MDNAIRVEHLSKEYPGFALRDLSFSVPRGSIVGLIGENGAGKTTTLNAILGLIRPEQGQVELLGRQYDPQNPEHRRRIGVVFDESGFPPHLTGAAIGKMMHLVYRELWDAAAFEGYCRRFALPQNKEIRDFSRGMKTKLSIAAALSHHPELLILDEPTGGLDPIVREEILDLFSEFIQDERNSILFSTHITTDLEKIADQILFLHKGELVFSRSKDDLIYQHAVARCTSAQFAAIAPEEYLRRRSLPGGGEELLVGDREGFARRHPQVVLDRAGIDEIMLFYVKGESK